jgi:uncharacterized protein (TIGR00369 family)
MNDRSAGDPAGPLPAFARACHESFARQTILATFQARLSVPEPGVAVLEMPFQPSLTQQNGYLHAGVAATLADSAGGFAALSRLPDGSEVLAVEFKINYLAPARGDRLRATGRCLKAGRTLSICRVEVESLDGDRAVLSASMQQTLMRVAADPAAAGS